MTREEVLKEIAVVNKRIAALEQKLDNYFVGLHEINANDITDVQLAMTELYEANNNTGGTE